MTTLTAALRDHRVSIDAWSTWTGRLHGTLSIDGNVVACGRATPGAHHLTLIAQGDLDGRDTAIEARIARRWFGWGPLGCELWWNGERLAGDRGIAYPCPDRALRIVGQGFPSWLLGGALLRIALPLWLLNAAVLAALGSSGLFGLATGALHVLAPTVFTLFTWPLLAWSGWRALRAQVHTRSRALRDPRPGHLLGPAPRPGANADAQGLRSFAPAPPHRQPDNLVVLDGRRHSA